MTPNRFPARLLAFAGLLLAVGGCARTPATAPDAEPAAKAAGGPDCCEPDAEAGLAAETVVIPDVELVDQDGNEVRFVSDLLRGRPFAINFVFTTCKGVCPVLGANFAGLLRERRRRDIALISVSVDPQTDVPARLKTWRARFADGPGWTLVTGEKRQVDRLLKALGVFSADKNQHTQAVLLGDGRRLGAGSGGFESSIVRVGGLAGPEQIFESLDGFAPESEPKPGRSRPPAEEYFTRWFVTADDGSTSTTYRDVLLTDQDGRERRFYRDLLKGRCVVIHAFFGSCTGACPKLLTTVRRLQDRLGPRLGRDVVFVSLSVDPGADTPEKLSALAQGLGARPGWYFLTGNPGDIVGLMRKLQPDYDGKLTHSTRVYLGNLRTDIWSKPDLATFPEDKILEAAERLFASEGDETSP